MCKVNRIHRIVKPAKCECEMVCKPIAPCECFLDGVPGTLVINSTEYAVRLLGELPDVGEPIIDGFRLTKYNGESHDICIVAGRHECTCGDYEFRRASQFDAELQDCKHIKACKQLFADVLRDQYQPAVYAGDYAVEFDDP